ncbi:GntR family transcriptional regulator [bacterium]|nr:GntR family transcriptional regulator [bacterium]
MKPKIKIDKASQMPVYKQLIRSVQELVDSGRYAQGDFLPSMNVLSEELEISKETVKKAYSILRQMGVIDSSHGKGFYVTDRKGAAFRILMLFDKLSTYKQVLYSSFADELGELSEITIRLHNQDIELFEHYLQENLDRFDYYIVTPHFPLQPAVQKRAIKALKRIPNRKLILLDHYIKGLTGNFGVVYQDFANDIVDGLAQAAERLNNYSKLNVVSMPSSMYAPLIEDGIRRYCSSRGLVCEIYKKMAPEKIEKNQAYLILNGQMDRELIELIKTAKAKGCKIGEDIGIISYNESPINEVILDGLTVFSTDFKQMGQVAARMIQEKSLKKFRCDFRLVKRNTF